MSAATCASGLSDKSKLSLKNALIFGAITAIAGIRQLYFRLLAKFTDSINWQIKNWGSGIALSLICANKILANFSPRSFFLNGLAVFTLFSVFFCLASVEKSIVLHVTAPSNSTGIIMPMLNTITSEPNPKTIGIIALLSIFGCYLLTKLMTHNGHAIHKYLWGISLCVTACIWNPLRILSRFDGKIIMALGSTFSFFALYSLSKVDLNPSAAIFVELDGPKQKDGGNQRNQEKRGKSRNQVNLEETEQIANNAVPTTISTGRDLVDTFLWLVYVPRLVDSVIEPLSYCHAYLKCENSSDFKTCRTNYVDNDASACPIDVSGHLFLLNTLAFGLAVSIKSSIDASIKIHEHAIQYLTTFMRVLFIVASIWYALILLHMSSITFMFKHSWTGKISGIVLSLLSIVLIPQENGGLHLFSYANIMSKFRFLAYLSVFFLASGPCVWFILDFHPAFKLPEKLSSSVELDLPVKLSPPPVELTPSVEQFISQNNTVSGNFISPSNSTAIMGAYNTSSATNSTNGTSV